MKKEKKNLSDFNLSDYLKQKKNLIEDNLEKIITNLEMVYNFNSKSSRHYESKQHYESNQNFELLNAMRYSLMAGGKRLRPILAIAAAEAVGGDPKSALPAACAIEMIHTYSLIHDDLPAMDNDDLRRGVPTCHKAFSEAAAILAGDALLTHAFRILSKPETITIPHESSSESNKDKDILVPVFEIFPPRPALLELIAVISDAAGANGMVEGQMMDMMSIESGRTNAEFSRTTIESGRKEVSILNHSAESHKLNISAESDEINSAKIDYLKKLHLLKTGKMIIASVQSGIISSGKIDIDRPASAESDKLNISNNTALSKLNNNSEDIDIFNLFTIYAEKIGLAFQVKDDILNVEGDPLIMGKAAGSDKLNDKLTFPALLGLDESKKFASKLIYEAIEALSMLPSNFQERVIPLKAVAQYILERKK